MYANGSEEWAEGLPAKVDLDYLLSYEKVNKHNCDISELRYVLFLYFYVVWSKSSQFIFMKDKTFFIIAIKIKQKNAKS